MKKYTWILLMCCASMGLQAQDTDQLGAYGENQVAFSPLVAYGSNEVGDVGVGLFYERFINDIVGLKIPVMLGLQNQTFQSGLAVKVYPGGSTGTVKFAIAPTILYTFQSSDDGYYYNDITGVSMQQEVDYTQLGFYLIPSLNMTIQRSFYISIEGGFGLNYVSIIDPKFGSRVNSGPDAGAYFSTNVGFRF